MNPSGPVVLLVVSDSTLAQQLIGELVRGGRHYQLPIATNLNQARARLLRVAPVAILLDESALDGEQLEVAARELRRSGPVVVVASPERQVESARLAELVSAGDVDFVARVGIFLPMDLALLERRMGRREQSEVRTSPPLRLRPAPDGAGPRSEQAGWATAEGFADFGEILRHEVNNPLTGILGKAELLLARRDQLPPAAVHRLETIADLTLQLRETIRRLSQAWEGWRDYVRSA
jgi:signal transduction histidine kinase